MNDLANIQTMERLPSNISVQSLEILADVEREKIRALTIQAQISADASSEFQSKLLLGFIALVTAAVLIYAMRPSGENQILEYLKLQAEIARVQKQANPTGRILE